MRSILAPTFQKIVQRPVDIEFDSEKKISNILWSKGPLENTYSTFGTEQCGSRKQIVNAIENTNDIVFIRLGSTKKTKDLDHFADSLHHLQQPKILVTMDGDRSVPSSYDKRVVRKILSCDKIKAWYTQNYDRSLIDAKLKHIPIGFDLHTKKWLIEGSIQKKISHIIAHRYSNPSDIRTRNVILCDAHNSKSHPERSVMYNKLKANKSIRFLSTSKSFTSIIKDYCSYNFVLAPRGNGLDTHRLWELLLCGVIPIVKTSPLDAMYLQNQLPVVIVDKWDDLNTDTTAKLSEWYEKYSHLLKEENIFPKLSFEYWLK